MPVRETPLFEIHARGDNLVATLPRAAPVFSWAHLHGGLRAHVRHILIHQVEPDLQGEDVGTVLRRAVSRARLPGTVVGICTSGRIADFGVAEGHHEELYAAALCVASANRLLTVGDVGTYMEADSATMPTRAMHLVLATNYSTTHEAMLEAMGIATEAKVQVLREFGLRNGTTGQLAIGSSMDCVAVTCGHDRRYTFAGKSTKWGELLGQASLRALRTAIQKALSSADELSPGLGTSAHELSGR